jgi:nucleoside-diphosphate-sugar epimerase
MQKVLIVGALTGLGGGLLASLKNSGHDVVLVGTLNMEDEDMYDRQLIFADDTAVSRSEFENVVKSNESCSAQFTTLEELYLEIPDSKQKNPIRTFSNSGKGKCKRW